MTADRGCRASWSSDGGDDGNFVRPEIREPRQAHPAIGP